MAVPHDVSVPSDRPKQAATAVLGAIVEATGHSSAAITDYIASPELANESGYVAFIAQVFSDAALVAARGD